jgi:hypothetical protein
MTSRFRTILNRVPMAAIVGVAWVAMWGLVSNHAPWTAEFWRWNGEFSRPLAIVTAALLVAYIGAFVFLMFKPTRHSGPDDAMAVGCISMVCFALAMILALLGISAHYHLNLIVRLIMVGTLLPSVPVVAQLAWLGFGKLKGRNAERQTWIRPDEIVPRLSGKTHVIERRTSDPPRRWRELRYYAPDGRMPGYKEEDGRIEAYPAHVTWRAEGGYLVTVSPEHLAKPMQYTLMSRPNGTISYYLHDESSPQNNQLLFRTAEIREGEPVVTVDASPAVRQI